MPTLTELLAKVRSEIDEVSVADLRALEGSDTVIIDVREADEFADGHLAGARLVPRGLLELRIESQAPARDTPIVLYCASGQRSAFAAKTLHEMGYLNVASLAGGLLAWKAAGERIVISKTLATEDRARYSRHLLIPEIGEAGQLALLESKVLIMGAGGLGSPAALYLAAAGVGEIGLVDSDVVDRSNLQRQVIHTDDRIGMAKTASGATTLRALNPSIRVNEHRTRLDASNVEELLRPYDVIIDGGDNFATRYLINDACVRLGIANVHGSVYRFEGQVTVFGPSTGPCYRCLYPQPPPPELAPNCQEAGVLGAVPGVIGLLQAIEAIKLIVGFGDTLVGRLLCYDAATTSFRSMRLRADPKCACCGESAQWSGYTSFDAVCGATKGAPG